jgi:hypothetical protein
MLAEVGFPSGMHIFAGSIGPALSLELLLRPIRAHIGQMPLMVNYFTIGGFKALLATINLINLLIQSNRNWSGVILLVWILINDAGGESFLDVGVALF